MRFQSRSALCLWTCVLTTCYDANWEDASLDEILDWASLGQIFSTSGGAFRSLRDVMDRKLQGIGLGILADDIVASLETGMEALRPLLREASLDPEKTSREIFELVRPRFVTRMLGILEPKLKAKGLSSIAYSVFTFLHEESLDMLRPVMELAKDPDASLMLILERIRPELITRTKNALVQRSRKMGFHRDTNELVGYISNSSLATLLPIVSLAASDETAALVHTIDAIRTNYMRVILMTLEFKMKSIGIDCLANGYLKQSSITSLSELARQSRLHPESALKRMQEETAPMPGKNMLCRLGMSMPSLLVICMSLLIGSAGVIWVVVVRRETSR